MRVVIQRVNHARVTINQQSTREIKKGLLVLLGIEDGDEEADTDWLCKKIPGMRIFNDAEGKMNLSVSDIGGDIMVVSQFTLHASTKKGNRPSFIRAAHPDKAVLLYTYFVRRLQSGFGGEVVTGEFGAAMEIELTNDGPVTILMDTKQKE